MLISENRLVTGEIYMMIHPALKPDCELIEGDVIELEEGFFVLNDDLDPRQEATEEQIEKARQSHEILVTVSLVPRLTTLRQSNEDIALVVALVILATIYLYSRFKYITRIYLYDFFSCTSPKTIYSSFPKVPIVQ